MDWYGRTLWQVIPGHDVIHVHQAFTRCGEVALVAAAQPRQKYYWVRTSGGRLAPGSLKDHPIALADRILAISEFSAQLIGSSPRPIDVVTGPVGQGFLDATRSTAKRCGALFVGRILPHNGIDRLIRAAPAGLPVTVAGHPWDKEYSEYLREQARGKAVTFIDNPADRDLCLRSTRRPRHSRRAFWSRSTIEGRFCLEQRQTNGDHHNGGARIGNTGRGRKYLLTAGADCQCSCRRVFHRRSGAEFDPRTRIFRDLVGSICFRWLPGVRAFGIFTGRRWRPHRSNLQCRGGRALVG